MFIVKLIGKILLIPLWIIVAVLTGVVSFIVTVFGFARVISSIVLTMLLIGTLICYHDVIQIIFLLALILTGFLMLFAGVTIEMILEATRRKIGNMIFA